MTVFGAVLLVIRRELAERTRQRSFAISTGVTLLIVLAISILPGVLGSDGPTKHDIGLVGAASAPLGDALQRIDLGDDVQVVTRVLGDRAEAERLVKDGTLDAAVDGEAVIVDEELGSQLESLIQLANRSVATQRALDAAGVTGPEATAITDPPPLRPAALDPPDQQNDDRRALVSFGVFFVFGQLFGYGFAVASSIVEEKSSRVVELLLAKISPRQLLAGKIVGVGTLGLAQLVLYLVVGLVAATASGSVDLPPGIVGAAALVLGWFVLGFAFYSALFAMAGAVASRVEELQNTASPITFVIMGGYVSAIVAVNDPDGPVTRITSFLPPFAPLVMPIRVAAGEAAPWELGPGRRPRGRHGRRGRAARRPGLHRRRPAHPGQAQAPPRPHRPGRRLSPCSVVHPGTRSISPETVMARTLLDLDDDALARAAAVMGTRSKVETVNSALRLVARGSVDQNEHRRFDDLLDLLGDRLAETDVRTEAWK